MENPGLIFAGVINIVLLIIFVLLYIYLHNKKDYVIKNYN